MDLSASIVPKSDQLNADDLISGPVTVTIAKVSAGSAEQPVDVHLTEFPGRAFRPSKSMRRVMVAAWGVEASAYTGRRMTLYRDPTIRFGGMEVGGIRISHLSHIDKSFTLALTVTRGKRAPYVVDPLASTAPTTTRAPEPAPVDGGLTDHTRRQMFAELTKHGITSPGVQRAGMSKILGREIKSRTELTEDDGRAVVLDLQARAIPQHTDGPSDADWDAMGQPVTS